MIIYEKIQPHKLPYNGLSSRIAALIQPPWKAVVEFDFPQWKVVL